MPQFSGLSLSHENLRQLAVAGVGIKRKVRFTSVTMFLSFAAKKLSAARGNAARVKRLAKSLPRETHQDLLTVAQRGILHKGG